MLNFYGPVSKILENDASSTVFRDTSGNWRVGCYKELRVSSKFIKLYELRDSLLLAQNKCSLPFIIEVDSMANLNVLSKTNSNIFIHVYNLVKEYR